MGREALEDSEIGGYDVPRGTSVSMSQWVVHRDPRFYDEPADFRPERWTPAFAYFPFGGGPRQCIGAGFAMLEATLLMATIAQRFRLRVPEPQAVEPWPSIPLRPRRGLPVVLGAR